MIKISPFKSEKQRKYLWMHHPEIAERWTKEYGSKPVGKRKNKKSVLEQLRVIVAEEINVAQPQQPTQTQTPSVQPQLQPQEQQVPIDLSAASAMIPQIMHQLDSSNMPDVKNYMITNMKVAPDVAEKATTAFAVKIYTEEKQKQQQKIVNDVAKRMGINPADLSKSSPLPPLPGTVGSRMRKLRLAKIIQSDLNKKANQLDSVLQQADSKSALEKAKELYRFISSVGPEEASAKIVNFADNILKTLPKQSTASTIIAMDKKTAMLGVLWAIALMSVWTVFNDKASNAIDNYGAVKGYWQLHPDKAQQAYNLSMAVKMVGIAGLASILSIFMKKKEQPQTTKKLYEGKL